MTTATTATKSKDYSFLRMLPDLREIKGANGSFYIGTLPAENGKKAVSIKIDGKHFNKMQTRVQAGEINLAAPVVLWGRYNDDRKFVVLAVQAPRTKGATTPVTESADTTVSADDEIPF